MTQSKFSKLLAGKSVSGVPESVAKAVAKQGQKINKSATAAAVLHASKSVKKSRKDLFNPPKQGKKKSDKKTEEQSSNS